MEVNKTAIAALTVSVPPVGEPLAWLRAPKQNSMYCEDYLYMNSNETIEQLTRLADVNRDAELGYRTAAEHIGNSQLETLFSGYAKQHEKFQKELQTELQHLEPGRHSNSETLSGALHRRWIDLKGALSGHSARSVLAACEDEAQSVEAAYADAGQADFRGRLGSLLSKQEQQIKETHTHLCRLLTEVKDGVDFQVNE